MLSEYDEKALKDILEMVQQSRMSKLKGSRPAAVAVEVSKAEPMGVECEMEKPQGGEAEGGGEISPEMLEKLKQILGA